MGKGGGGGPAGAGTGSPSSLRAGDGTELYIRTDFPPDRPRGILLVVHGWGEHQGLYDEFVGHLTGRGLAVWRYDQRGHGRSGGRRGHAAAFGRLVQDLGEVWRLLEAHAPPGSPRFVLGHSMGGLVVIRALQTGAIRPDGVCLSAPWLKTRLPVPGWKALLSRVMDRLLPSLPFPNPLEPEMLTRDAERRRIREQDPLVHHWITPRLAEEVRRAQVDALNSSWPASVPVLALIPLADPVVDPEVSVHFVERLGDPEPEIVLVEDARHEPLNEVDRRQRFDEVGGFFLRLSQEEPGAGE